MVQVITDDEKRYRRHLLLNEIGKEGQRRIGEGRILIVGLGGLGSPAALYLAAAGVGTLGLIDHDRVDLSNLQRQIIHTQCDVGKLKVESAKEKLLAMNPALHVETFHTGFSNDNAADLVSRYDFILDCTDNYDTKFLINDVCVACKKPFSHGSLLQFEGQCMTYKPGYLSYRDLFAQPPGKGEVPTAAQAGVFSPLPGIIGTIQASEALKYLCGAGTLLLNRLLVVDALTMEMNIVTF